VTVSALPDRGSATAGHGAADAGGRASIIAVSPLIREMMIYPLRWPIERGPGSARDDRMSDGFFRTLADRVAEDVSRAVSVSERTLRRLFQDTLGLPWRTYLLQARMMRAMALLAAPGQSVQTTSSAVGFESLSSFTRCFTQFCSETPSAYRRRVTEPAH
jgi:AraC-like DNA-binding protein